MLVEWLCGAIAVMAMTVALLALRAARFAQNRLDGLDKG